MFRLLARLLRALDHRRRRALAHRLLLIALVLLVGGTIAIVIDIDGPDGPAPPRTIAITVNATPSAPAPPSTLEVPAAAVEQAARRAETQLADDDVPAGVPDEDLAAAELEQHRIRETRDPLPTAGATQEIAGCRTSFIGTNWSSRNGVRPTVLVMHYTVSSRRPGWGDVDAIVAHFSRPSTRASSHFVVDDEGHCRYLVPLSGKAWTQAAGNPFAVSIEVVAMGHERQFMQPAGWRKLRQVVRQISQRTGIPLRRGAVSGCTPTRSGIVHHADGGACWGGHHDITPFAIDEVVARVSSPEPRLTAVSRRIRRGLTAQQPVRVTGHSRRWWCRRSVQQRRAIIRAARADGPGGWRKRDRRHRRITLKRVAADACR